MAGTALKSKSKSKTKTVARTVVVPLGERVVVSREEAESTTKGGIVLPDSAQDKPQKGTVVAVGEGRAMKDGTLVPLTVKEGDRVLFQSYGPEEIQLGDEELLLLKESDILATF